MWFVDDTPSQGEVKALGDLLSELPKLKNSRVNLVSKCFAARKTRAFDTLAQLSGNGKPNNKFYSDIRHLLGRLGEHLKAAKTMVSAALMFPAILDVVEIRSRASAPSRCFFQSPDEIQLEGMSERIFNKEEDIKHYQEALHELERKSSGALLDHMRDECRFKTRIHAELLLVDLFYWRQFEFVDDDPYIGCSKPACFNCFQYLLAHPGNFSLPACHNKLYLSWRTPDIPPQYVSTTDASKIREAIVNKINSSIRAELRRQIDGRYPRRPQQFDSVTGVSSSQGSSERPFLQVLKVVSESASSM
jgi:hypothetical protein